jgi:hypothetical protein
MPLSPKNPAASALRERLEDWTRARFALGEETTVMVSELACAVPGCPPVETVVAFWLGDGKRHHFKVFKPLADVAEDDLPPPWMRSALAEMPMLGCECC